MKLILDTHTFIWWDHVLGLSELPFVHKDPFDRLLIAQAKCENAVIVTADPVFANYAVPIEW